LIGGTENALQHALLLSPLLRFTGRLLLVEEVEVCFGTIRKLKKLLFFNVNMR